MILKHRGASHQRAWIVGIGGQQLTENGGFSRCSGRPLLRRNQLGLLRVLQPARHADSVMLLTRHRDADHVRQKAGGERLRVDDLARPYLQLRQTEQDVARGRKRLRGFGRAIDEAGWSGFGLHRVAGEENVSWFRRQGCLHTGSHELGPGR